MISHLALSEAVRRLRGLRRLPKTSPRIFRFEVFRLSRLRWLLETNLRNRSSLQTVASADK